MKPALLLISFALCTNIQLHAEPHYIVIHKRLLYGWKLEHVSKPEKRLERWTYDKANDTYFRVNSSVGLRVKAVMNETGKDARYVSVKQGWSVWKISHVEEPKKKLKKWYLDPESGTHYRIRYFWGCHGHIR
ncbi:MAG: hypothetical protein KF744_10335 [Taibaiella sp.]|nr:hypothetical protein [Taibaiella sp.]